MTKLITVDQIEIFIKPLGGNMTHPYGIDHTLRPCTGIGVTATHHNRLRPFSRQPVPAKLNGRRLNSVCRKRSRHSRRLLGHDQGQVRSRLLDPHVNTRRLKSFRGRYSSVY